jgi:heterodisulfide reductase subunit B
MEIPYYPGCTLKLKAMALDQSTVAAFAALDVSLKELPRWTCCGAVYPLTARKIAGLAAPIRILREAKMMGSDIVVTACAFCYNVLKRANKDFTADPLLKKRINAYLADDVRVDEATGEKIREWPEYAGAEDVKVLHLLEFLRDRIGFHKIPVKKPLRGLRVAPYYGCTLLRPAKEVGLDDPERPTIMHDLLRSLGAEPIDFPFLNECCASFLSLTEPERALRPSYLIMSSAEAEGAQAIAVSCPLCYYNMEARQLEIRERHPDFKGMPVFYFTELLALGLGVTLDQAIGWKEHSVDVRRLLESAGLIDKGDAAPSQGPRRAKEEEPGRARPLGAAPVGAA